MQLPRTCGANPTAMDLSRMAAAKMDWNTQNCILVIHFCTRTLHTHVGFADRGPCISDTESHVSGVGGWFPEVNFRRESGFGVDRCNSKTRFLFVDGGGGAQLLGVPRQLGAGPCRKRA